MPSVFDLKELYQTYFNKSPYYINPTPTAQTAQSAYPSISPNTLAKGAILQTAQFQSLNKKGLYGLDVWFPITLWKSDSEKLDIDACTVSVSMSKTIIKTAVSERKGTVKECFAVDDKRFVVKGFLIGEKRRFPEKEINLLTKLFETSAPVQLQGGYVGLFFEGTPQVAMTSLEFPEVEGKNYWIRPFSFSCESDTIVDIDATKL